MRIALLGTLCLAACSSSGAAVGTTAPRVISRPAGCNAPPGPAPAEADVGLFGIDATDRAGVDQRLQKGEVVALHLERRCGVDEVEILKCTRPALWVAEARESKTSEARADVQIDYTFARERHIDWPAELRRAGFAGRWGEWKSAFVPPLQPTDLLGIDCARATHWATVVRDGSFSAHGGNGATETSRGSEPISLHVRRLSARPTSMPAAFPPATAFAATTCPAPVVGQLTEQAAQALRLFQAEKWPDAFVASQRVALGDTGDDVGNQQIAAYQAGIALGELGMFREAIATLEPIARAPCHVRHAEAAFWLTIRDRRTTF